MISLLVFGAGAVGSLVAARLSRICNVTIVGREDHISVVCRRGLEVRGITELVATDLKAATHIDEVAAPEVVLVTVKSNDTRDAVEALRPFWNEALFVSLQNGLGNEEILAEHVPRVLGAVINQGVTYVEPGIVFHAGERETLFAPFAGSDLEDARRVVRTFVDAGIPARAVPDIRRDLWAKTILNAAVNPVTALLSKRTGELLDEELASVLEAIVRESVAIARASGIELDVAEILESLRAVAQATKDNKSSMLQDLERGRPTEIDAINGALVERARALSVPAPLNALLTHLVRARASARKR
ncbi:MAG TPA: ketopantoate reductase family protein [Vicinamibacteria bacterium]|nr:ketopantoate reductase family protein [Vicinamibacteria bacterium]